jgi:hypothetical protein
MILLGQFGSGKAVFWGGVPPPATLIPGVGPSVPVGAPTQPDIVDVPTGLMIELILEPIGRFVDEGLVEVRVDDVLTVLLEEY